MVESIENAPSQAAQNEELEISEEQTTAIEELALQPEFMEVVDQYTNTENTTYDDPEAQENIKELITQGKITKVVKKVFGLLGSIFGSGTDKSSLEMFADTGKNIDFASMTPEQIEAHIDYLENAIKNTPGVTRKLHLTKILSNAKNVKITKENEKPPSKYQQLTGNIQAGDILLLNKRKDTSIGSQALRALNEGADFTHSVLITEKNGELYITHSTMHKESGPGAGVEEYPLDDYLAKHKPADILTLQQTPEMRQKSIDFAQSQIGKEYDNKVAAATGAKALGIDSSFDEKALSNDKFNCVELIAQSYQNNETIKNFAHPVDFIDHNLFIPSYMTSIEENDTIG